MKINTHYLQMFDLLRSDVKDNAKQSSDSSDFPMGF